MYEHKRYPDSDVIYCKISDHMTREINGICEGCGERIDE